MHDAATIPEVRVTGFPLAAVDDIVETAEHLNADHEDTVLLVARVVGDAADATAAAIAAIDPDGIDLAVDGPSGATTARAPFDRATDVDGLYAAVMGLVGVARAKAGDAVPVTSIERELTTTAELQTYVSEVVGVTDLAPRLRQLTVRGGLEGFPSRGGDQFLYVMTAGIAGAPVEPGLTMADYMAAAEEDRPPGAYYTVRRWRPEVGELDLWVVVHDRAHGVAGWAAGAGPGARLALWGPRTAFEPPPGTTALLLLGDETALPAIAAILDGRADGLPATAVIEAGWPEDVVDLPVDPDVDVRWVFRRGAPAGTGTALLDAVRSLDLRPEGLYAFGAAEARRIAEVRAHLRAERDLPGPQVRMSAYWRRRG